MTDKKEELYRQLELYGFHSRSCYPSKAEIAEEVYFMYSGAGSDREHDLFEEVVQLRYENEKKDGEIRSLKQKLKESYEFMKRFMIGEMTLFEKFMQGVKEKVRDFVVTR